MQGAQKLAQYLGRELFTKLKIVGPLATMSDNEHNVFSHLSCETWNTIMIFELQK